MVDGTVTEKTIWAKRIAMLLVLLCSTLGNGCYFLFFCLGTKKFWFLIWGKRKEGILFGNRPIRCVDRQMDRK
jgi:hypothetical protein